MTLTNGALSTWPEKMSPVSTTPTGVVLADGEGGGGLMGVDYNVVGDVLYVVANNLKSQPSRNTSSSAALAERQVTGHPLVCPENQSYRRGV